MFIIQVEFNLEIIPFPDIYSTQNLESYPGLGDINHQHLAFCIAGGQMDKFTGKFNIFPVCLAKLQFNHEGLLTGTLDLENMS